VLGVAVIVAENNIRLFLDFLGPVPLLSREVQWGCNMPEIGPRKRDDYGRVHLPPGTAVRWGLTEVQIGDAVVLGSPVVRCEVHFEYRTIIGDRKVLVVRAPDSMVKRVASIISGFRSEAMASSAR
jgi:hypothetical protein